MKALDLTLLVEQLFADPDPELVAVLVLALLAPLHAKEEPDSVLESHLQALDDGSLEIEELFVPGASLAESSSR